MTEAAFFALGFLLGGSIFLWIGLRGVTAERSAASKAEADLATFRKKVESFLELIRR